MRLSVGSFWSWVGCRSTCRTELEARVKAFQPDTPTSQVIRAALERYVGGGDTPAYAQVPDDVDDLLAAGVVHFAETAKRDYQDGYRAALRFLPHLSWFGFTELARVGFDLYKWLNGYCDTILRKASEARGGGVVDLGEPDWWPRLADDLGHLANPISLRSGGTSGGPRQYERRLTPTGCALASRGRRCGGLSPTS